MNVPPHSALHPQTKRHLINSHKLRLAAIQEFAQHGLQGAKVSNIVAAAQLTQPSFYRTWPSKEAAYADIILKTRQEWRLAAQQILSGPDDMALELRILEGVRQLYGVLVENLELTHMVMYNNQLDDKRYEPFIEIYTAVILEAQNRGIVTQNYPAELLAQAYTALTKRIFMARLYTRTSTLEAASIEIVRLVLPLFSKEETK